MRTAAIDIAALLFPELAHQWMYYVLHVCSLWNIAALTRLEIEGIEKSSDLANYADDETDTMADSNRKQTQVTQCDDGIILHIDFKSGNVLGPKENGQGGQRELSESTVPTIDLLIRQIAVTKERDIPTQIQNFIIPINL